MIQLIKKIIVNIESLQFPSENKPHKGSLKVLLHIYNFKRWTEIKLGSLAPPVYSTILKQQFKLPTAL